MGKKPETEPAKPTKKKAYVSTGPSVVRLKDNLVLKACSCKHSFQDEKYGHGTRIHNAVKTKDGVEFFRCTVCGNPWRAQDIAKGQRAMLEFSFVQVINLFRRVKPN